MVAVAKRPEQKLFLVGGNFETLGSNFRNETEGLLPSPPPKTIIKKEKDIINYETSNFHHHGLKI